MLEHDIEVFIEVVGGGWSGDGCLMSDHGGGWNECLLLDFVWWIRGKFVARCDMICGRYFSLELYGATVVNPFSLVCSFTDETFSNSFGDFWVRRKRYVGGGLRW